jgi:hypothetical protein
MQELLARIAVELIVAVAGLAIARLVAWWRRAVPAT